MGPAKVDELHRQQVRPRAVWIRVAIFAAMGPLGEETIMSGWQRSRWLGGQGGCSALCVLHAA